jgi:ribokinase
VDTSGAGDAFAAGFLAAWLRGVSVERALATANACGALAAATVGPRSELTPERVRELLDG